MADFTQFTHKWRAVSNGHQSNSDAKVTKRNRQPVSCQPCRARKLKCDRGHPCDGCIKRHEESSCVYGKPASISLSASNGKDGVRPNSKAQDRLKHLEDLVRSMVESPPPAQQHPNTSYGVVTAVAPGSGDRKVNDTQDEGTINRTVNEGGFYTGSTHWSAILQHIHELRNDINAESTGISEETTDDAKPDPLFGDERPPSLDHVLRRFLPPRIQIDRRISQYFNAKYLIIPILHANVFRRQYEKFWRDPSNANPLWVSIMFSICSLAASLSFISNKTPPSEHGTEPPQDLFRTAAGQCLVLANYSKPQQYVVEALALFLQCKYSASLDPQREVTLMFGILTRLAFLMGYHRDASNFPKQFSAFEGEMRRRTWAMVKQFDLLVAFQLGIPNNIPPDTWDTHVPSNLLESDFDEDTLTLPPSRPETEVSQVLYFCVKSRIIDSYCKVCHHALSFPAVTPSPAQIMALDADVRAQAAKVPASLTIRPISESITDPAHELMVRLNISFLWRKALCVLHRKYMVSDDYSYKVCVETASAMCASLIDMYPEFQAGGRYEGSAWMFTSFTVIDFLLAIIVLCLAMSISRKKYLSIGGNTQKWLSLDQTRHTMSILDSSLAICQDLSTRSREAKRVSGVLSAVLERLRTSAQGPAVGSDETRYHLHMSNGTLKEDRPYRTAEGVFDRCGVDLRPLSLSERGRSSFTPSTSLMPPDFYDKDRTAEIAPEGTNGTGQCLQTPSSTIETMTDYSGNRVIYPQKFRGNAAAPKEFNMEMNMDIALGPFTGIIGDLEANHDSDIDWTQFDQFTGPFSNDLGMGMLDGFNTTFSTLPTPAADASNPMDYHGWESTPLYSLGGRARNPLTGERRDT